ncbi:TetR/AcrR family transcriptional regulator [Spirillospora albida]|uniref:TetR/AcrR family transcriptional regulator n=1 Tax=Spirillospora albida TaxID=58123 RepID=UPI00068FAEF8|nr:TetR/AcrR family transcriptional regulator [Spirillospora albida]
MSTDDTPQGAVRQERADVRRNRARLLAAAREVFGRDGAGASLEAVARRAGVGIGTLYRHFPARQDLLEALLADGFDRLAARARDLASAPDPGEALLEWLRAFVTAVTEFRGMAASARVALWVPEHRPGEPAVDAGAARSGGRAGQVRAAGEALFVRARDAGDVPSGADFADVLALACAVGMVAEQERGASERLLSLAASGFRCWTPDGAVCHHIGHDH